MLYQGIETSEAAHANERKNSNEKGSQSLIRIIACRGPRCEEMLHVFVDEAGVPGSTLHFMIGFAFFPDENYKLCVDNIKRKIKSVKGKEPRELHFHDLLPKDACGFSRERNWAVP